MEADLSFLLATLKGLAGGLVDLVLLPWHVWQWWELGSLKARMSALTLAGQSVEFLYMMLSLVILLVVLGSVQ